MARKRIIYQSQAVAIEQASPLISQTTLMGVQSCNYGVEISREDVNQYGQLGAIDKVIMDAPTCTTEVNYYCGGFGGPSAEGANLSGLLQAAIESKTASVLVALDSTEGEDYAISASDTVVVLESGSLTSLSADATVGGIPTNTLNFQGLDFRYSSNTGGDEVAVPGTSLTISTQTGVQITLSDSTTNSKYTNFQTCGISFDLGTEVLRKLGDSASPYYYGIVPTFPAQASINFESLAIDDGIQTVVTNLKQSAKTSSAVVTGGMTNVSVNIGGTGYKLVNGTVDSHNFSSSIGDNVTLDATFNATIGGASSKQNLLVGLKSQM